MGGGGETEDGTIYTLQSVLNFNLSIEINISTIIRDSKKNGNLDGPWENRDG